jgi:hypothetical protein
MTTPNLIVGVVLFVFGLRLKPEKQAEISKGLFVIETFLRQTT